MNKIFGVKVPSRAPVFQAPPPWRTDLRRKDELPDMKVVRTHFLLNHGVAGLALFLVAITVWHEKELAGTRREIRELRAEADGMRAKDAARLRESGEFSEAAKVIGEFVDFRKTPPDCLRIVSEIGGVRMPAMVFNSITVEMRHPDPKTGLRATRVVVLGKEPFSQPVFDDIKEAYRRFLALPVWKADPRRVVRAKNSPERVESKPQENMVEFSFELWLEEKK